MIQGEQHTKIAAEEFDSRFFWRDSGKYDLPEYVY